jgi:hypothetical protein
MDYIKEHGLTTEWAYPYTSYFGETGQCDSQRSNKYVKKVTISDYVTLPSNDQAAVLHALVNNGPLVVIVQADAWSSYQNGVMDPCTDMSNVDLNHAVVLTGYGKDYWTIRNSWGVTWGEKGYARLKKTETPACGTDKTPKNGVACADDLPESQHVCGTCGMLFDVAYPVDANIAGGPTEGDINR